MKRYERYKDSGVQWIGEVPDHWGIKRAKYMFNKEKREVRDCDEVITCFRDGQVTLRKNRRTTGFTESLTEIGYQGVRKGDLVIHQMDAFAGSIGVSDSDGKGTSVYHCCTPKGDYDTFYYAHLIRRMAGSGFIQSLYRGIRERSSDFKYPVFGNQYLIIPPINEQHAIVDYLKDKTNKIGQYVAARERELLESLKQSEIANVVTKGLNPNASMKDSGIFWVPQIPSHWETTKLKHVLAKLSREKSKDAELLICSNKGKVLKRGDAKIGLVAENSDIYQGVCKGDLLIHGMDTWHGAIAISDYDRMCTPVVHVCDSKQNKKFIAYYLQFMALSKIFKLISNGVRQNTSDFRSWDKVGAIPIALPPLSEQQAIVAYIDEKLSKIDRCLADLQAEIDYLKEFKQRLISDAVTGQICVAEPQKGEQQ